MINKIYRQPVKSKNIISMNDNGILNINNISKQTYTIRNDDKKEKTTIFNEKIRNASEHNKSTTRQRKKLLKIIFLNLSERVTRAIRCSKQHGISTTSSNVNETNTSMITIV